MVCTWPLQLCFGLFADDICQFFHFMVILLVYSAITMFVSMVMLFAIES